MSRPLPFSAESIALPAGATDHLALARRSRRYGTLYALEHKILLLRAYGGTIVASTLGNPLIYLFALGVGLATLVDGPPSEITAGGYGYLAFVAPALLAMAAVSAAIEETTYPVMGGFKWDATFYAMNAAPLSARQIASANVLISVLRIAVACTVYFGFLLLFGAVPSSFGWLAIVAATLGGAAVSAGLVAFASQLDGDDGVIALVMRFVITPMMLFSGTFFPLSSLPIFLQPIGWISPLWHAAQLGRVATYGLEEPIWLTLTHVVYLVVFTAVGWMLATRITTRRLGK